jgi:hypothetical protein
MKKPKSWKDKMWSYCSPKTGGKCDGQYRRHKSSECEGKAHVFNGGDKKQTSEPEAEQNKDHRKLRLAKAYKAMQIKENSEESD